MLLEIESLPKYRIEGYFEDLTKINKAIKNGEHDYALSLINILERDSMSSNLLTWNKIKTLKLKSANNEIIKQYQKLISSDLDCYFQYSFAKYLYEHDKFSESIEHFNDLLAMEDVPRFMVFLSLRTLGSMHTILKDYDSAEECFNRAYTIYTNCSILSLNYGLLELNKSNYESAKSRFSDSISMNPKNDLAWLGLSYCHQFFGEKELHQGCCLRALDENPQNTLAKVELEKSNRFDAQI